MGVRAGCVFRGAAAALFLGVAGYAPASSADPLDKDTCSKLQAEKQTLSMLGVDKEYAKGPDWAKANLRPAELNNLRRFINIDEQLKFRCGFAIVTLRAPATDEPEDGDDNDEAGPNGAAVPMPGRREDGTTAAKPATAPAKTEPASVKPKPAAKPAAAKAQSSWNAETTPVLEVQPAEAAPSETILPKRVKTGDQG